MDADKNEISLAIYQQLLANATHQVVLAQSEAQLLSRENQRLRDEMQSTSGTTQEKDPNGP